MGSKRGIESRMSYGHKAQIILAQTLRSFSPATLKQTLIDVPLNRTRGILNSTSVQNSSTPFDKTRLSAPVTKFLVTESCSILMQRDKALFTLQASKEWHSSGYGPLWPVDSFTQQFPPEPQRIGCYDNRFIFAVRHFGYIAYLVRRTCNLWLRNW